MYVLYFIYNNVNYLNLFVLFFIQIIYAKVINTQFTKKMLREVGE